jgi:hypothetical protein
MEQFCVSEMKLSNVKKTLMELIKAEVVSRRIVAKVANKIIAMGPAVLPASLYNRPLFQALQGHISWDGFFPAPQTAIGPRPSSL